MITATVSSRYTLSERQIDPESSVQTLRQKLEQITGIPPKAQEWIISLPSGNPLNAHFEPDQKLKKYLPDYTTSLTIEVQDARPEQEQFSLDESVEKYEMSTEKYQQRQDSVLKWKQENRLGRFADTPLAPEQPPLDDTGAALAAPPVGARVLVTLKSGKTPQGTLAYLGAIPEIPGGGIWAGVALDSADGKNDGTLQGARYFECAPCHGVFVKPSALECAPDTEDEI